MAQDSEPELTAEVVAKRFADSADALAELHDQLMTLATAEENATTAASDINQVVVKYKSSAKSYTYSTENADEFDTQLLNEFDSEDISVGRFINQSVSKGTLTLLQD